MMKDSKLSTVVGVVLLVLSTFVVFQNCSGQVDSLQFSSIPEETPIGSMVVDPEQIAITPSGCTDSVYPVCDGSEDKVRKRWGTNGLSVGANSENGAINTNRLRALDPNSDAAAYCANMIYGGFDDWYLPSRTELEAMYQHRKDFGKVNKDFYWSSTETDPRFAFVHTLVPFMSQDTPAYADNIYKEPSMFVRCIRKIN